MRDKTENFDRSQKKCHKTACEKQSRAEAMKAAIQISPVKPIMTRETFSGLVCENHATLTAYARMITGDGVKAGEVVQDAFVTAWQNIGKFDVTRDVSSWLRGIVRNKWREACRRGNREISMDEETLAAIESTIVEWQADRPEVFDRLAHCRGQLPSALAESVDAFYDEQLSTEEAAVRLEINGATLRKRLERAREALRQCLQLKTNY
jgi:RNA polymerase sigma factor (sigma-70 family)